MKIPLSAIALLTVYICWSTTYAAIHVGLETLSPEVLACQRFLLSGTVLCLIGKHKGLYPNKKAFWINVLTGFLLFTVGNGLPPWALQTLPTGLAAALVAFNPFWMIGLSRLFPPVEVITPIIWIGFTVGFAGILTMLIPHWYIGTGRIGFSLEILYGCLGLITINLAWCVGSLLARRQGQHIPSGRSYLALIGQQNFIAAVTFGLLSIVLGHNPLYVPNLSSGLAISHLGLLGTCLGMMAYLYTLNHCSVLVASTFSYVTPVLTAIVGVVFLNEPYHWSLSAGLMLILGSVGLIQWQTFGQRPYWPFPPRPVYHLVRWITPNKGRS